MNTPDENRAILFDRFLLDDLSSDERVEMNQWLSVEENRQMFESWKKDADRLASFRTSSSADVDVDLAWKKVQSRIRPSSADHEVKVLPFRQSISRVWQIAAVLIVALGLFFLWKSTEHSSSHIAGSDQLPVVDMVLAKEIHATYEMHDGSSIELKKNSQLVVRSTKDDPFRQVDLTGEAFFDVSRDEQRPFIIHAGDAVVRVLGTSFLVKTLADSTVMVYVEEGTVLLFNDHQAIMDPTQFVKLEKGDVGELNKQGIATKKKQGRFNLLSWFTGTLKFKEAPMENVVSDLQDYFEIKIEVKDPNFKQCKLTARFKDKSIEEVMESLKLTFDIEIENKDGRYIITGKGC